MPTHLPIASPLSVRLAHLNGLTRKPKVTQAKAAKASAPRPPERSTRAQSVGPAPASRFLHLNANLPPVQTQVMPAKRASEPTKQELVAQVLAAGKPRPPAPPRTKAEKLAAEIMATHAKLRLKR